MLANDFAGIQNLITAFYAGIPNEWFTNNRIAQYEGFYASVFYSYFAALGWTSPVKKAATPVAWTWRCALTTTSI